MGDMADDALPLRIGDRLDIYVVAGPVDPDTAHIGAVIVAAGGERAGEDEGEAE